MQFVNRRQNGTFVFGHSEHRQQTEPKAGEDWKRIDEVAAPESKKGNGSEQSKRFLGKVIFFGSSSVCW